MGWLARLFTSRSRETQAHPASVFVMNTLSGKKELFVPRKPGLVTMYTCGPTVYSKQHIGNLRSGVVSDTLARVLTTSGYRVQRVTNITDVGHLTDDDDHGEDKVEMGARREGVSPTEIAERYAAMFIHDLDELNIDTSDIRFPRATEYIREQIALAKTLDEKGFAYRLPDGLYFDTSRFPGYGRLGNLAGASLKEGARVALVAGKRHGMDFALWRAAKPADLQQWDSPWGRGNPGWHLECSAMIRSLLGTEIDIHTGGEDLATVHHNNEIAQSEAASGRPFVHYWLHHAFVTMNGEKVSKSVGNVVYLSDIVEKGYHPLALRYFFLQAYYRTPLSFSWDALASAASALDHLWNISREIAKESGHQGSASDAQNHFVVALRDDLATPQALSILWDALRSEEYTPEEKWKLLETADASLGLSLVDPPGIVHLSKADLPLDIQEMLSHREAARAAKDFSEADRLRADLANRGYRVDDGPNGPVLTRNPL